MRWYAQWCRRRAAQQLAADLPGALQLMAQALRAGMNMLQALQLVATQTHGVMAMLCAEITQAVATGRSLSQELQRVAAEWPNPDLQLMTLTTVALGESGGNLAQALTRLGAGMHQRRQLQRRVRVYATQGMVSAAVITALPLLLCGVMALGMPRLVAPLWQTPLGWAVLALALLLQTLGLLWMRRIMRIAV